MRSVQTVLTVLSLIVLTFAVYFDVRDAVADGDILINQTDISGYAFSNVTGAVGVNMAAGDDNAQVNARAITIGDGAPAFSHIGVHQRVDTNLTLGSPSYHLDYIGGEAFAGSNGIISVNQAAGNGSAQANLVSIGIGFGVVDAKPVSSNELLMSYGRTDDGPQGYSERRFDVIEGNAFSGSQGLVQVNQSAGSANRVLNTIAIQFRAVEIQ